MRHFILGAVAAFALQVGPTAMSPAASSPVAATVLPNYETDLVRIDDGICGRQCQAVLRARRNAYREDDGICGSDCQTVLRWRQRNAYRQDDGICGEQCQAVLRWRRHHGYGSYGSWDDQGWRHPRRWHYRAYEDD